jgi:tRNA nucleotidyltransferase (CCA-adding enzyme)
VLSAPSVRVSAVYQTLNGRDINAIAASVRISQKPEVATLLRRFLDEWRLVTPILTGDDLLAMGVPSGVKIGEILRELHAAKLDGLAGSVDAERALVVQIITRGS